MKPDLKPLPPVAVTFDIDWAPDWAVDECVNICDKYGAPATFFVTHQSKIINDFSKDRTIELGIHPNFLPGSSHGNSPEEVLAFCRSLVPHAKSMRTHSMMQWSWLYYEIIGKAFPGIEIDSSLCLMGHEGLHPVEMPTRGGGSIKRLPYFWEDDLNALSDSPDWSSVPNSDGLCIFVFHPIHVCLNMTSLEQYKALKNSLAGKHLSLAAKKDFDSFTNTQSRGTKDFLIAVFETFQDRGFMSISNLAHWYDEGLIEKSAKISAICGR